MNFKSLCFAFFFQSILLGCGPSDVDHGPLGTLSGKVLFEGKPVTEGQVLIEKQGGGGSGGADIQADGTYLITDKIGGVPVGNYLVSIIPPTVEVSLGPDSPPSQEPKEMPNLPPQYHMRETSGLTVEIKQGENTKDFELVP